MINPLGETKRTRASVDLADPVSEAGLVWVEDFFGSQR